jgi:two-component system, sporulation sensor kinase B
LSLIQQLLLNMLIVITPVLLYQIFWLDRKQQSEPVVNRRIMAVICLGMVLLCMTYPFELFQGFRFDFRFIPIALCFLYVSPRYALGVSALLILYRIYLGGIGMYSTPFTLLFGLGMLALYRRSLPVNGSRTYQVMAGAVLGLLLGLISALTSLVVRFWFDYEISVPFFTYFSLYILLHGITLGLVTYVIEQIKENLELRNKVQHNDKMHVLSELAASFAHEIRNPMTVARGFVQMMNQQDLNEEKRQIYSSMVLEEMDKTQSIINDYLSFARPQLEAISLVDAKQLIERATSSLETYAELRNVKVELHLQDKLMISANADKFTQCIVNLCKNGIEAMPSGGTLQIVGAVQSQTVCIDVIDQGIGMTSEEIGRLGNPFFSTRGKGTGLGMMVTYRVIQNIQGRIDVTSEVGKGTCFSILIPSLTTSSYH